MKLFVCIKGVPDTETKIRLGPDSRSIETSAIKWILNPYDEFAVEESIKLRDQNPGSQIVVVSMGSKKSSIEPLRTALAMGADEGILIDVGNEFLVDPFVTAKALAHIIQKEGGASLVLCGRLAIDDNASSVPQMLAEKLGFPHVSVVSKLTLTGEKMLVERDVDGGSKEVIEVNIPAVVSANKGLNLPRYASLPGIMKAKKKTIKEIPLVEAGAGDFKTKIISLELPPEKPSVKMLSGPIADQVSQLVKALRDEAKVL